MYYHHSGKIWVPGLVLALAVSSAIAFACAWVYSYAILYIPLAGYVTFILTGGFGLVVAIATGAATKIAKTRNNLVGSLVAFLVALVALYSAWAVWLYALFRRSGADAEFLPIFLDPEKLWTAVKLVNAKGAWSLKGSTPTGAVLWGLWGLEAAFILGIPLCLATADDTPFCEECGDWCEEEENVGRLVATTADEATGRLEARDFAWFASLGAAPPDARHYARVDLAFCEKCHETNTLTLNDVVVELEEGEFKHNATPWVKRLLLERAEVDQVRTILDKLKAAAQASDVRPVDGASDSQEAPPAT